jgi:hypothetical protein
MIIKLVCVSRNEYDLLEDFIRYHAMIVGFENIILLDNGSDHLDIPPLLNLLRSWGVEVIEAPDRHGMTWKSELVTQTIFQHQDACDFIIPIDTDEFIVCSDDVLANQPFSKERILEQFQALSDEASLIKFPLTFHSMVNPEDVAYQHRVYRWPAREMKYFEPVYNYRLMQGAKCFFRAKHFVWGNEGNHDGVISSGEVVLSGLGLFHFHQVGSRRLFEKAALWMDSRGLVDRQLPFEQQLSICERPYDGISVVRLQEYHYFLLRRWVVEQFVQKANALPSLETLHQLTQLRTWQRISEQLQEMDVSQVGLTQVIDDPEAWERLIFHDPPLNEAHPKFRKMVQSTYVSDALS